MGGADEATDYVEDCGSAWRQTPGAVAWLNQIVAALPKKARQAAAELGPAWGLRYGFEAVKVASVGRAGRPKKGPAPCTGKGGRRGAVTLVPKMRRVAAVACKHATTVNAASTCESVEK